MIRGLVLLTAAGLLGLPAGGGTVVLHGGYPAGGREAAAELYAIESEDHYLRVHTSAGQELILMRLADAVRELAGVEGLQTHRSWWVARCSACSRCAHVRSGGARRCTSRSR